MPAGPRPPPPNSRTDGSASLGSALLASSTSGRRTNTTCAHHYAGSTAPVDDSAAWRNSVGALHLLESHSFIAVKSGIAGACCGVMTLLLGIGGILLLVSSSGGKESCEDIHCNGNGACRTNSDGSFRRCECDPGWSGLGCEHAIGCDTDPCGAHGTCSAKGGSHVCTCSAKWEGEACETMCGNKCNDCSRNTTRTTIQYGFNCGHTLPVGFQLLGAEHQEHSGTYMWVPKYICNDKPVYQLGGSEGPVRMRQCLACLITRPLLQAAVVLTPLNIMQLTCMGLQL